MPFNQVVVLGGSVAGLLAAAALSDSFESVTLVEPRASSDRYSSG
jgi:2-polyprenyl-6-methoxyphenol hydroxylase-like FAD-dependent oxidoreductase